MRPWVELLASPLFCGSLVVLAATALLTGKRAVVQVASAGLGAIWLICGLAFWSSPSGPLWLFVATVEAVSLLQLSQTAPRRSLDRRESSPRPAFATSLVALAAAGALTPWLEPFRWPATGFPWLPWPELLTLGFLLGSRRRRGPLAIAAALPPLLSLGSARFGLLAGGPWLQGIYLAGFALGLPALLPGPRVRPENQGPEEVTDGRDRLAWRRVPGWLAWCGLGTSLAAGLLLLGGPRLPAWNDPTRMALWQTVASGLVVALAAGALSLRFSAWSSPAFRHLAWRAAHAAGRCRAWLRVDWHGWVLGAILVGSALTVIARPSMESLKNLESAVVSHKVLLGSLAVLVLLLHAARQIRRRIFVEDFTGPLPNVGTGAKPETGAQTTQGAALAACLRHDLEAINSVYRTIDEALPRADGRMPKLEVTVEDVGANLTDTIGQVPVNKWTTAVTFLLRLTGLLHGPHLSGTFHREGSLLVLTVELSGGGHRESWRMREDELAADETPDREKALVDGPPKEDGTDEAQKELTLAFRLVRQMAYRIATSLASLGSPRWEAVQSFTNGLRAYRRVRLTDANRDRELRQAECCFREALQYDKTFTQGHYNLGVVYSKLGELDAALATFRQAIAADPSSFSAHLAVAMAYFDRAEDRFYRGYTDDAVAEDFLQARVFAARAVALAPHEPRPWNVYGAATACWGWRGVAPQPSAEEWTAEAQQAVDAFRVTSALSWRRLCRAELVADRAAIEEAKLVTLICLENLAEVELERGRVETSLAALTEALRLAPRKRSLHLLLGKALASSAPGAAGPKARLTEAENELYDVHADGLPLDERAGRWAWLLAVHRELWSLAGTTDADRGERERQRAGIRRAWWAALDCAAPPEELVMEGATKRAGRDPSGRGSRYGKQLGLLRSELQRFGPRSGLFTHDGKECVPVWAALDRRLRFLEQLESGGTAGSEQDGRAPSWTRAQLNIRKAREVVSRDPRAAVRRLHEAIDGLRPAHPRQVRDQGLDTMLARAYLGLSKRLASQPADQAASDGDGPPKDRPSCLHGALDYALRGVAEQPESALRHEVLAEVYEAFSDHALGDAEREAALSLGPVPEILGDKETLESLYESWQRRIQTASRPDAVRGEAIAFFERLRELLESAAVAPPEPSGKPRKLRSEEHGWIHHYLGKLQEQAAARHEDAAANLAIARANGYPRPRGPGAGDPGARLSDGPGRPGAGRGC